MRRGLGGRARDSRNCVSQLFGDIRGGIPGDARRRSPEPERPGTRLLPTAREKPGRALVELLSQPVNSFGILSAGRELTMPNFAKGRDGNGGWISGWIS